MGGIYQNSLLAIAASKAADNPEGCFNDVEPATGKDADQNEDTIGIGIESKEEIKPEEETAKEEEAESEVAESQTQDDSKGIAFEIVESNKSDSRTMLRLLSTMFNTQPLELELSPLNKRGWVLQERILSSRTAHFTSTEVVWEFGEEYLLQNGEPWLRSPN